jgi:hypothetical protein
MRVMRQRGTPGVQHRHEADASAEMRGIRHDRDRGLGRGFEQQVVDHRLVLIGDVADLASLAKASWAGQFVKEVALLSVGRKFANEGAVLGVREQLFEPCL